MIYSTQKKSKDKTFIVGESFPLNDKYPNLDAYKRDILLLNYLPVMVDISTSGEGGRVALLCINSNELKFSEFLVDLLTM